MNKKFIIVFIVCFSTFTIALAQTQTGKTEQTKTPIVVLKREQPIYPANARKKGVEGTVRLRVTFKADGEIGDITDATENNKEKLAKYGLTEQAIIAARKIKFKPAAVDGEPITVIKTVEYVFSVY